jgi:hypothetical protein
MGHVTYLPMGRHGNAFFQVAAIFAYAKKHRLQFSVPKNTSSDYWSPIILKHLQRPDFNENLPTVRIIEQHFHYAPLPFEERWRDCNILLEGYFQSEKYFGEYRDELIETFGLPYKLKEDTCSIHARYGDYLEIAGKHIIVDEEYILKAIELVKNKTGITKFKVFSDNLNLFKERHGHLYNFEYSSNTEIMDDLVEISCCHSNIGSSSTFSWWAQYLNRNPDKVVITQSKWFQDGWTDHHGHVDTSGLIPTSWIKL